MKLDAFLKKHLFDEIGVTEVSWRTDATGNPYGMAGLQIKPEDLAQIGQLILDNGKWQGKQVISQQWLNHSFAPLAVSSESGLMWWLIYDKQYMVIDDAFLEKVRPHADTATMTLLERAKGKYEGFDHMQAHLRTVYSAEEIPLVAKAFSAVPPSQMRIANEGDVVGYAAVGYLGQYLIIIPEKRIVVVRMISADSYKQVPNNSDLSLIRRLAKQL
jgi:CubicO group peptidase (beta-lactamase class C family)